MWDERDSGMKILFALLLIGGMSLFGGGLYILGVYNTCVEHEEGIKAQYKQNQNNYDKLFKSILETAGVTKQYSKDLKELYAQVMQGRKGSGQELFRSITEANPAMDTTLYAKVQTVIETGRLDFEMNQKSLIERVRVYRTYTGRAPASLVAGMAGFPRIDFDKYDIVTSGRTTDAFESKRDEAISPFSE